MATPAPSLDPWTRARERFLQDLNPKERSLYDSASLENIFYDANAVQRAHIAQSTTYRLSSKIQPFIAAIDQYRHAFDVLTNTYPLGMAPLWGSMRVLIQVSNISYHTYHTKTHPLLAYGNVTIKAENLALSQILVHSILSSCLA